MLEWDSAVAYDHPAAAMGSDNKLYLSVRDSTNVNPVTNTTYTDWQPITRSMRDDIVDAIDAALGSANWQQGGGMFSQTQTDYSETDSTDVAFLENRQLIAPLASPGFTGQPTAPTPGSNNDSARIAIATTPALTGNPTAPTQSSGNDSTRLATTAFVRSVAPPTNSPTLTGNPRAPTPSAGDNDTSIATTAYVQTAIDGYRVITSGTAAPNNSDGEPNGSLYIQRS